ncbi:TPA: hypothetical protein DF272_06225 [Candidatus Falkowbacteria bacterium]|nr:hypothetical protein [Candidatus Falkowbacteria bacterium]
MDRDEKFNKVVEMMNRAETDPRQQEHLRVFLFQMIEKPEFDRLVELFDKNHELFDKFVRIFELKLKFFEFGDDEASWNHLMDEEKEAVLMAEKSAN